MTMETAKILCDKSTSVTDYMTLHPTTDVFQLQHKWHSSKRPALQCVTQTPIVNISHIYNKLQNVHMPNVIHL